MAVARDTPYGSGNFLVEIAGRDARRPASGFSEVSFPAFTHVPPADGAGRDAVRVDAPRLVLRRGATGDLDLYQWWNERRRDGRATPRTVTVHLLAEDHETVVMTWRFQGARPVSLGYSPLHAVGGGLLVETLELEFDRVEME